MADDANCGAWRPASEAGLLLPAILLFYLLVYSAAFTTHYAVTDDYLFLEAVRLHDRAAIVPLLLEGGRPLLAIIALGLARLVQGIGDLAWARAFGVLGIGAFAAMIFYVFRRERQPLWLALAAAFTVGLLPAFQVFAAWAVCAPYPYAAALGGAAFLILSGADERGMIVARTLGAIALLFAALAIYQPSAMAFWCFAAIWSLSRNQFWNGRIVVAAVVVFCCAMLLDFAASKLLPAALGLTTGLSRTALTHSPWHKLVWFVHEPLVNSASLFAITPSVPLSLTVCGAIVLGALVTYRSQVPARLLVLALLLVAAYVPNLVVAEDWASYRTTPALAAVILITVLILVVGPVGGWLRKRAAAPALLPLLIAPLALSAAANVTQTYSAPSSAEYLLLREALVRALDRIPVGSNPVTVCIVPARWQSTLSPISRYDEFGVASSSVPYALQAIVGDIAASVAPVRQRPAVGFRVVNAGASLARCDERIDVDRLLRDVRPDSATR